MSDLVRVYSTASTVDGEITKAHLETEGIPVMAKGEGTGPYRMGPLHLWVPSEFEPQARLIIEAIARGEYALDASDTEEMLETE